jgi:gamma-glutamylcyclotransferase (GGCT)/AIG2-like uncharacterized protein YtfP
VLDAIFLYGTLKVGHCRWPILAPYIRFGVAGTTTATAPGRLYDTGLDYPAACFDRDGTIWGQLARLRHQTLEEALELLDQVEGTVEGDYKRTSIRTHQGGTAWAYEYGGSTAGLVDLDGRWSGV